MTRLIAVLSFASAAAWGQVEPPLLGYLPESGRVRPVYGIPAAALISAPLDLGSDFTVLAVSPAQDYLLGSAGGSLLLIDTRGNRVPIQGAAQNPGRVVISSTGSAAALWFGDTQRAEIVSGLPASPRVREVDLSSFRASSSDGPSVFAVSDDGEWLAGAWPEGFYASGPSGELRRLPVRERVRAVSFYAGRHDLAVATQFHIFSIADPAGTAEVSALYSEATLDAAALAISGNNQRLVLAERSGRLTTLDLASGSVVRADCGCMPDGVARMGRDAFRITNLTGGTFRMLDTSTNDVFLVPLGEPQGGAQ